MHSGGVISLTPQSRFFFFFFGKAKEPLYHEKFSEAMDPQAAIMHAV